MQRPGGDTTQFRHGSPAATPPPTTPPPPPPGFLPGTMSMGRPFAPPAMQSRGPMMPPPRFPGGQQRPGFVPSPAIPQSYGGNALPPGQPMSAPPPIHMMSSQPVPGPMPSRPLPPSGLLPAAGPQVPPLGQTLPGPPPGAPPPGAPSMGAPSPLNSSSIECGPLINSPLPPSAPLQGSQGPLLATVLPPPPQKPIDDEMVRNIEILSQFVAKNGPGFENMARDKQAGNSKFSFLFGGEPGSDAAIGHEYFHWFKMKCQIEQNTNRQGEGRSPLTAPSVASDSSQQPRGPSVSSGPKVALGGSSTFPTVSDMEMDMDMEDDVALPMLIAKDGKNIQTTVSMEGELQSVVNTQQTEERGAPDCQESTSVVASGNQVEATQSELQKEKGSFDVPRVEDVSPARSLQELQHTLTIEISDVKSFPTSKEELPAIPNTVSVSDALPGNGQEVALTGLVLKSIGASTTVDLASERVILAEKRSGPNFGQDDMECRKTESVKPCNEGKSFNEVSHSSNRDQHVSLKNNISSEAVPTKPNITSGPDNAKSEMQLHLKPDNKAVKIDKYGRIIREGNSDSESDGGPYGARGRTGPSQSRSPSPNHNRWRKRSYSRSPRRKTRWSSSRSRSPKRRRSRSRTPVHDFRRGGDARGDRINRGRGTQPVCNDFSRGRCQRGASCRFLHWESSGDSVSRWAGGRGRERIESRQDVAKSVGGKESFLSGELDKPRSISPDRFFDEHENHNFGERRNQESYGYNDRVATPCYDFSKGRCHRGSSCRYLHSETAPDSVGRWSSAGNVRERTENRQDIEKPFGGKDGFGSVEVDKTRNPSPNRLHNQHYRHNFRERRSHELDRGNGRSVPACFFFARGCCTKGASCRFFHPDATGSNDSGRSRERPESRSDITEPFGGKGSSAAVEMDRNKNLFLERTSYGHDRRDPFKGYRQETEKHNYSPANPVVKTQFSTPGREKLQSHREELWSQTLSTDAPSQSNHRENVGGHLTPRDLPSKSLSWEKFDAEPSEGPSAPSVTNIIQPHNPGEDMHQQPLQSHDLQFQTENVHSKNDLNSTPSQSLPKDLPAVPDHSVTGHSTLSGQSHGSESYPLQLHDVWKGSIPAHSIVESNVAPLPSGYSTNSSMIKPPAKHSGIGGCSMSYHQNPITPNLNSVPQPGFVHGAINQDVDYCANDVTAHVASASTEQRSVCARPSLEPVNLQHVVSTGQESLIPRLNTMPLFPQNQSVGQIGSLPLFPQNQSVGQIGSVPLFPQNQSVGQIGSVPLFPQNQSVGQIGSVPLFPQNQSVGQIGSVPLFPQNQSVGHIGSVPLFPQNQSVGQIGSVPLFPQNQSVGQIGSVLLALCGEQKTFACSQTGGPFTPGFSTVNQPSKDIPYLSGVNQPSKDILGISAVNQPSKDIPRISSVSQPSKHIPGLSAFNLNQPSQDVSGLSAVDLPHPAISAQEEHYDPSCDGIDCSAGAQESLKRDGNTAAAQDVKEVLVEQDKTPLLQSVSPHNKDGQTKPSSPSRPQDIVRNNEHKDCAELSLKNTESHEAAHADVQAGIALVLNGSPRREGKGYSPGHLLEAGAANAGDIATEAATENVGDIATDQAHAHDESKKSKEIRMMKLFRSELAEFVKEVLKPTWREGQMSKEAFKTIVKKVVDKVAGSLQGHQVPKSQEKIDQFLESSRQKLTKLVQGYVDKYVKA